MADESEYIKGIFEFHPCDTPRGMLYYKLNELTEEQKRKLNSHKINIIRNNQKYLHDHPEIKVITSTLLQAVLKARPKYHVHKFLVKYLLESWDDIKKEVDLKTIERRKKVAIQRQRYATIAYLKELYDEHSLEEGEGLDEDEFRVMLENRRRRTIPAICKSILEEIIQTMEVVS